MKHVNARARKVLDTLTEGMGIYDLGAHRKIDTAPGFMAVSVEMTGRCEAGPIYSVAHYYEQNGDLMRDPDVEFIKGADGEYYPISFWQDNPPVRNEAVTWSKDGHKIAGYKARLQAEITSFASQWMGNISQQQNLKAQVPVEA